VLGRPRGGDEHLRRAGRPERLPGTEAGLTDRGVDHGIDAEDQEREDLFVLARSRRDQELSLGDWSRRLDAVDGPERLERTRPEPGLVEGPKPDVGPAEQVGGRGAQRRLGRRAGDDRRGEHRHAQRDADDRQCRAKGAGQQPAPGQ
jgi:hypothetical protein